MQKNNIKNPSKAPKINTTLYISSTKVYCRPFYKFLQVYITPANDAITFIPLRFYYLKAKRATVSNSRAAPTNKNTSKIFIYFFLYVTVAVSGNFILFLPFRYFVVHFFQGIGKGTRAKPVIVNIEMNPSTGTV